MITPLGDMDEEFDEGVVADHHRTHDSFGDPGCLQYQSFDKSGPNWVNMLRQQGASVDATSPQTSHLSSEVHSISDLTSFDYGQRLPSLEGSSSAPSSKGTPNMAPHSVFAWQPFGNTSVHNQPQASSFHGQPGHLIPLIPGSTATYSGIVSSSPASSMPTTTDLMDCHQKNNSHYAYPTNYSSSSTSNKSRSIVLSPSTQSGCCPSDVQNIRLGMLLPNSHSPTTAPVPIYAPSLSSTTTSSSAPHQAFCSPNSSSSSSNLFSTPSVMSNHPVQDPAKAVSQKQRSKKESHNRIERKRRDYINSQIVYLSSLLPPELYRDVDGRRNKGSVLRLSVSYIMELREAVSRMESLKQENTIARQLIPLLLQRIESLEKMNSESSGDLKSGEQLHHSSSANSLRNLQSLEAVYQSWLLLNEANQRSSNSSGNTPNLSTSVSRHSIYPAQTNPNDSRYLHELMMQNETPADLDFSGSKLHSVQSRHPLNVKREHGEEEEERTDDCGSLCNKSDTRRPGCSSRSSFTDHQTSERIEEEVTSQDGSFDSRPNSAYECYPHNLPRTPQSSVFLQNH